ncbi:caprin-2-like [Dreissena polymorpha]|uniref:C1q domain-containing protein n=1 Tax=Dreissena polymorpha TaxID=45954 RepID=A0A9D4E5M9_DREPO|nr:caprin-2-like [Dreissena polymorpha]KAH3773626.1 hypothetical protein DPMN_174989 [Dreissena polymorpha]
MRVKLLALAFVCLVKETGAEDDLKTRVAILEQAVASLLDNDALRLQTIRSQEYALNTQQLMLTHQAKTIEQLKETINVQAKTIKKFQARLDNPVSIAETNFPSNSTGIHDYIKQIVQGKPVERRTALVMESPIAFTAVKTIPQSSIGINQNIKFDKVILNDGGGFHVQHGIFIAPVSGYYLFSTSIAHDDTPLSLHAGIMHNGNIIAIAQSTHNIFDKGAQTVVLKVSSGDEIWIQNLDYEHASVYGESYSTFTGVLLYQL